MENRLAVKMVPPIFRLPYRVLYADTDAGGVVYHAGYLRLMEMGRGEMMRAHGIPYAMLKQQGFSLPIAESYLRYKAPAHYDDLLEIEVSLAEVTSVSCRFNGKINRPATAGRPKQLLVKGFTVHACTNREGILTRFPKPFFEQYKKIRVDS